MPFNKCVLDLSLWSLHADRRALVVKAKPIEILEMLQAKSFSQFCSRPAPPGLGSSWSLTLHDTCFVDLLQHGNTSVASVCTGDCMALPAHISYLDINALQ